jgi:hypothetical protein
MTRIALRLLGVALVLSALCATVAQAAPELNVPRTAAPPRIDGRLDEACWQRAPQITEFRCVDKERSTPTQRTQGWVVCDGEALYVAARCTDDQMAQVPATVAERDGPVWQDDCLEVFLMPGTPYYYHFAANLLGARYDARQNVGPVQDDAKPAGWNGEWQVAARREADCWTMELTIPFATLEWGAARLAAPFRFNLGREQRRLTEFSCWPASEFNKTEEFAVLHGLSIDPQRYGLLLNDVSAGPVIPGTNRYSATIAEEPTPGVVMTVRARVKALPDGTEQVYTTQVKSVVGARMELDYQVPLAGGRVSAVFECLEAQGKARASRSETWRVPAPLEAALDLPLLYRSDAEVRLSGKMASRGAVKLEATLVSDGKRLAVVPVRVGPEGAFRVSLPVRSLTPGRYALETRLTSPGAGAAPVVNQFPFRLIAGPLD